MGENWLERNSTAIQVVVTVVLAVIGIWFTWYQQQKSQTRRTFDHRVVDDLAILSGHEKPDYIKVMAGIFELEDPRITRVKFKNTGGQAIDESDFRDPYIITREGAKLLDYSVIGDESFSGMVKDLTKISATENESEKLLVRPGMMNKGKEFTLRLLYDGGEENWPVIRGQFFNQSRDSVVIVEKWELTSTNMIRWVSAFTAALMLFIGISNYFSGDGRLRSGGLIFIFLGAGIAIAGFVIASLRKRSLYRREQSRRPEPMDYRV